MSGMRKKCFQKKVYFIFCLCFMLLLAACGSASEDTDTRQDTAVDRNRDSAKNKEDSAENMEDNALDDQTTYHIALHQYGCAAVTENGDLYYWGKNQNEYDIQTTPQKILENVAAVYLRNGDVDENRHPYSVAVMENGDLYQWNFWEAMGSFQETPVKVLENVVDVVIGGNNNDGTTAAITENGDLYCWGENKYGQVGNGTTEYHQYEPVKVLENVLSVESCRTSMMVITQNGDLYCWGGNYHGQLGNGTTEDQSLPTKILDNISTISRCDNYLGTTCAAITKNKELYCWGLNYYGQAGGDIRDIEERIHQAPVKMMENVTDAALGIFSSAALTENGDVYSWGHSGFNGTNDVQPEPVRILENVQSIFVDVWSEENYQVSMAVTENGDLYSWGSSGHGQLGRAIMEGHYDPAKILEHVSFVSVGALHSAAITENGDLYCWGCNEYGQVGNGTTEDQFEPVKVLEHVVYVSVGEDNTFNTVAVTENGDLYCWGRNDYGQVGNGTTQDQLTPVKILSLTDTNAAPEPDKIEDEPTEESAATTEEEIIRKQTYADILWTISTEGKWPDGATTSTETLFEYSDNWNSGNRFAVCDIDHDGKSELLVDTDVRSAIYDYDVHSGEVILREDLSGSIANDTWESYDWKSLKYDEYFSYSKMYVQYYAQKHENELNDIGVEYMRTGQKLFDKFTSDFGIDFRECSLEEFNETNWEYIGSYAGADVIGYSTNDGEYYEYMGRQVGDLTVFGLYPGMEVKDVDRILPQYGFRKSDNSDVANTSGTYYLRYETGLSRGNYGVLIEITDGRANAIGFYKIVVLAW